MNKIQVLLRDDDATLPTKSHAADTGYDLYACEDVAIMPGQVAAVNTGISIELPPYQMFDVQVRGRSGLASEGVFCHVGTVDVGYRGEIRVVLHNTKKTYHFISVGDRIAQLVVGLRANLDIIEVCELDDSDRGEAGLGSTGR